MISYEKLRDMGRDSGLDVINLFVDYCLRNELFVCIDDWLKELDLVKLTDHHLIGVLTATLPAKNKLHVRSAFYDNVVRLFKIRGTWEPDLLKGLE